MKPKTKVILGLAIFFIAVGAVIMYGFYAESTKTVDFGEFSVEVPQTAEFIDISSKYTRDNHSFVTSYRCTSIDLTISSFNKTYLEENYQMNTGETIDSGKYIIGQLTGNSNLEINETSGNTTIFVEKTLINGHVDTDVAGVYNDDNHLIIIEGGDIDFIKNVTYTLKIKDP